MASSLNPFLRSTSRCTAPAQRTRQQVRLVRVEAEPWGVELQQFVVGASRYLVECEYLAPLHRLSGLCVVVVHGGYGHTLRGLQFVAQAAREVAVVEVHHSYVQLLRLPLLRHGGEEDKRQRYGQRQDDQIARTMPNPPQLPICYSPHRLFHCSNIAVIPGFSPSMCSSGTTFTSKLFTSYWPLVLVARHVA